MAEQSVPVAADAASLKRDALTFASNVVIGIASAAPAYSLASALGTIAGIVTFGAPAILLAALVPMLCVASAYFHLNRADPDCGTTFAWVRRAMGPYAGWIGGWALIVTNILVMPSLAVIAGQYSAQLVGIAQPSMPLVTLLGSVWIVTMTAICYHGIEFSARMQRILLVGEFLVLAVFVVLALTKAYGGHAPATAAVVSPQWFNPLAWGGSDKLAEALLVAVFIYWGWDTGLALNEETRDPKSGPGHAALVSNVLLVGVYVSVAVAALAFAGPEMLAQNSNDIFAPIGRAVMGPGLDKLLILTVLTSASASTQTSILPATRTALSMSRVGALPPWLGRIHPATLTPGAATLVMGLISLLWFVGLTLISKSVLDDSVLALGLCISFYYALTAFACVILHAREITASARNMLVLGAIPAAGGLMMAALFVKASSSLYATGATRIFGIGGPLIIGIAALVVGLVPMLFCRITAPAYFGTKPAPAP